MCASERAGSVRAGARLWRSDACVRASERASVCACTCGRVSARNLSALILRLTPCPSCACVVSRVVRHAQMETVPETYVSTGAYNTDILIFVLSDNPGLGCRVRARVEGLRLNPNPTLIFVLSNNTQARGPRARRRRWPTPLIANWTSTTGRCLASFRCVPSEPPRDSRRASGTRTSTRPCTKSPTFWASPKCSSRSSVTATCSRERPAAHSAIRPECLKRARTRGSSFSGTPFPNRDHQGGYTPQGGVAHQIPSGSRPFAAKRKKPAI